MQLQKIRRFSRLLLIMIWTIIPLIGCSREMVTSVSTSITETAATVQPTETMAPSVSPSSTSALTVTATPDYILTPPLPLSEVFPTAESLLNKKTECLLPCWWGLEPGKTTLNEAMQIFLPLRNHLSHRVKEEGIERIEYWVTLPKSMTDLHLRATLIFVNHILKTIDVSGFKVPRYNLGQLLAENGQPDEVYLSSWQSFIGYTPPMNLFLFYKQKGILVRFYVGTDESILTDDSISGCFSDPPTLFLWEGDGTLSFEEVVMMFGNITEDKPILPINEASKYTVEDFFEYFYGSENDGCIEIDRMVWPEP